MDMGSLVGCNRTSLLLSGNQETRTLFWGWGVPSMSKAYPAISGQMKAGIQSFAPLLQHTLSLAESDKLTSLARVDLAPKVTE